MTTWTIGAPHGDQIKVELLSKPDQSGAYEWISVHTSIASGAFKGEVGMSILASDMERFINSLESSYNSLSGSAEFSTMEDQLRIVAIFDISGHVKISGYLRDYVCNKNTLKFSFSVDQTYIRQTISELKKSLVYILTLAG